MGYVKKNFDGEYLRIYNVISSHGNVTIHDLNQYNHVYSTINSLNWKGDSKDSICNKISQIDTKCDAYFKEVSCMINKTKITYGVLFQELKLLKATIEKYNSSIDDYNRINTQLQSAKSQGGGTSE